MLPAVNLFSGDIDSDQGICYTFVMRRFRSSEMSEEQGLADQHIDL